MKLLSVKIPGLSKGVRPVARHPDRFRTGSEDEGGHLLVKDCDCLPEYDFVRLAARAYSSKYGPFVSPTDEEKFKKEKKDGKLYQDEYTLQIIMARDSKSIMLNMCFSVFVVDVLTFSAHGIPVGDLADRLSVNLTLLLTAMAFKWVLSDSLPPVPYLTELEYYVIATFFQLFLQGFLFWVLADAYNFRCKDDDGNEVNIDYWTGLDTNKTDLVLDISCSSIYTWDRSILIFEIVLFCMKNTFAILQFFRNRASRLRSETHFKNLGGLGEFSMKQDMIKKFPNRIANVDPTKRVTGTLEKTIIDSSSSPDRDPFSYQMDNYQLVKTTGSKKSKEDAKTEKVKVAPSF